MKWVEYGNDIGYFNGLWGDDYLMITILSDGLAVVYIGHSDEGIQLKFDDQEQAMAELGEAFS